MAWRGVDGGRQRKTTATHLVSSSTPGTRLAYAVRTSYTSEVYGCGFTLLSTNAQVHEQAPLLWLRGSLSLNYPTTYRVAYPSRDLIAW